MFGRGRGFIMLSSGQNGGGFDPDLPCFAICDELARIKTALFHSSSAPAIIVATEK